MEESISVSQLCVYIKSIFDAEALLQGISIYGEVSGYSYIKGNAYFTLKDDLASIPCVFFGYNGNDLEEGEKVVLTGSPNFYVKGGKLNFSAYKIMPFGKGEMYLKFLITKQMLEKEGLFDDSHKRPLPKQINKIGIVTSKEGAVLQDIINVTTRRNPFVNIVVYPARVQGNDAYKTIIKGINHFNKTDVDVIIVARGGGSAEDLSNFNNESLARCVANSKKVVISAVGHETDFTIIDFVADVRASTPSVAGEFVTKDIVCLIEKLKQNLKTVNSKFVWLINQKNYRLDKNSIQIQRLFKSIFNMQRYNYQFKTEKINALFKKFVLKKEHHFLQNKNSVQKLNPMAVLNRGFAKIEQDEYSITSIKQIGENNFDIHFKDGKIKAKKV